MTVDKQKLEREFFRMLNRIVEPAVRMGFGSPRFVPSGLIVLETKGFKSGLLRRTPLAATRLQGHVFISTARGEKSLWVKNLRQQPSVTYHLAGKPRNADAIVISSGNIEHRPDDLPVAIARIIDFLVPYTHAGWAFAVLSPQQD
ncbi:MAG: nitroreductase/quinone reductase family protein [Oceanicoccus sp.]